MVNEFRLSHGVKCIMAFFFSCFQKFSRVLCTERLEMACVLIKNFQKFYVQNSQKWLVA